MAAAAWLLLSFSSCIVCGFDSYTVLFKCLQKNFFPSPRGGGDFSGDTWKVRYTNQIRTRYKNWRTSATQLQPSKSLCYIGCTSTWLYVRSCVLMQEATTFNIFYDGISFQHLATILISVFALCYGPGLLFRGPRCMFLVCCNCVGVRCMMIPRRPHNFVLCRSCVLVCVVMCSVLNTSRHTQWHIFLIIRGIYVLPEDLLALLHGVSWLVTVTVWTCSVHSTGRYTNQRLPVARPFFWSLW